MLLASISELEKDLSVYLAEARRKKQPIIVTRHSKPYVLIRPITEPDLESLEWKGLARKRLSKAWEGEDDGLYDYLRHHRRPDQ
jgi:prevent-host-death family protein